MALMSWDDLNATAEAVLESSYMQTVEGCVKGILISMAVPEEFHPDAERIVLWCAATVLTLLGYWIIWGRRHRWRRYLLQKNLDNAMAEVAELQEKLEQLEQEQQEEEERGTVRIWMDGAFDMLHYGHMNAFRQGRALGTHLVVGVNSDASITQCKGAPVLSDPERLESVRGCKWVDEVVEDVPYIMNKEYLEEMVFGRYKVDYVVHGDDPCIVNGEDVYQAAKESGRYKTIPRTEGISTTDIVGRMLLTSKSHHRPSFDGDDSDSGGTLMSRDKGQLPVSHRSQFLTTSRMMRLFSAGVKSPAPGAVIVYVDGAWDMFHHGHIRFLEECQKLGDYVIVGIHSDATVNTMRGSNLPILNLHERVLSVLGCKFADDVLIDAPWKITREMIASLNITYVASGRVKSFPLTEDGTEDDPYQVPRDMGIMRTIDSPSDMTVLDIVERIHMQHERFAEKFQRKKKAEDEYYADRYNLHDDEGNDEGNAENNAEENGH